MASPTKTPNQAYFLAFTDGGFGYDQTNIPLIPRNDYLLSVGAGFRYRIASYLTVRVDYGFKLHNQADFTGGDSESHFSVTGSY